MTPGSATPRGIGFYTSRIVRAWDERTAKREIAEYREAGTSYVLLCAIGQDFRADHGVLVDVAGHLQEAGIRVGVYALPSEAAWMRPEDTADRLADAGIACGATIWAPDIEEQARGRGVQVRRFRARLMARSSERVSILVTFYGRIPKLLRPSRPGDGLFPWAEIAGWGTAGYQLYRTAEDDRAVDARMADAAEHWGPDVVPHLGTYLGDAARLRGDLERTCLDANGNVIGPGVAFWQDITTNRAERVEVAAYAARFAHAEVTRRAEDDTRPVFTGR